MRKDQASEAISACISEKISEGYEQSEAVAICLSMAERGELGSSQAPAAGKSAEGRQMKTVALKNTDVDLDAMEFSGYASTWDRDEIDDIIHAGAFRRTIEQRGPEGANKIKVLWQHSEPLGLPLEMREDSRGLWTRSRVSDTQLGRDAMTLIRDGVIDRMSIGFSIPNGKADMEDDGWTRHIREVKLYEYSPVTFACNEEATIEMAARMAMNSKAGRLSERSRMRVKDAIKRLQDQLTDSPAPGTPATGVGDSGLSDSLNNLREWARHRVY